jgi:hypothetical protein
MAAVLLCNSTLQSGRWLSSLCLSLGTNTTLKSLSVGICNEFRYELCTAIRNGLANNSTLEKLSLYRILPSDDNGAVSVRNALSFLRTNSTLMSLTVSFAPTQGVSYVSTFRFEAVAIMEGNLFLESLDHNDSGIKVEQFFPLFSSTQL